MKAVKSLQKFTDFEKKYPHLAAQKQITTDDLRKMEDADVRPFLMAVQEQFILLDNKELDKFHARVENILFPDLKNQLWERNHMKITAAISNLMLEYHRMPMKNEIASEAKLSRQTVHKHLKEYASHPAFKEQTEEFRFVTSSLLARVYNYALAGDMAAAKLYFTVMGNMGDQGAAPRSIKNQNNYIQINGMVLSQESVKQLSPDQLGQIEAILKPALAAV